MLNRFSYKELKSIFIKMKHSAITTLILSAIILTGCKTANTGIATPSTQNTHSTSGSNDSNIIDALNGDWAILDINGTQVMTPDKTDYPYLGFQQNSNNPAVVNFYAYNGCNFINGALSITNGKVTKIGENATTMKLCPDAKYETAISSALEQIKNFKIQRINNESFLYITDSAGKTIMTLRKHNLNFIEGAWRIENLNGKTISPNVGMAIVIDLQSKTVHGNTACNILNGTISIDMERENGLRFGDIRTTRMSCPNLSLEQLLLSTLPEVRSAIPGNNGNTATLRNADNRTIITLKRLSKEELRNTDL